MIPGNLTAAWFLAIPRLWGFPGTPQAQAVALPTRTHRYPESPYGSSPLGSLLRSVRPPGTAPTIRAALSQVNPSLPAHMPADLRVQGREKE